MSAGRTPAKRAVGPSDLRSVRSVDSVLGLRGGCCWFFVDSVLVVVGSCSEGGC